MPLGAPESAGAGVESPPVDNRIIYFSGAFNEEKAHQTISKLLEYECKDPTRDILLFVDSYGGYVDSFVAIHDTIKLLRCDVATCCVGKAMSCGQMLLISGTQGKRFITPNSRVMIHQIASASFGKLRDLEVDIEESKRLQKDVIDKLILKYTKIKPKQLKEIMVDDTFVTAKKALDLGVVDHIVTNPNILYKNINI
jgi:ATP-dependent Clp protease protease subunit